MAVNGTASDEEIIRAVENAGYGARLKGEEKKKSSASEKLAQEAEALADHETPKLKRRLIWSAVFLALLMYITMGHNMLGWPVPAFFDHNHLGLALTEMFLALIVMHVNKDFSFPAGNPSPMARRIWIPSWHSAREFPSSGRSMFFMR